MKKRHTISFVHALEGLVHALKTQPNFLIHLSLSILVFICGIVFQISSLEWIILSLVVVVGLALELINTSIESVVDLITLEWRKEAKVAKDTSAAAMLIFSLGAIVVALIIFVPKILTPLFG